MSDAQAMAQPRYGCCEHCEHEVHDRPHARPCPEGCNDDDD